MNGPTTANRAGDVLSEHEVAHRINEAVESLQCDVDDTIRLHNIVCKGDITIYEDDRGPLDAGGEPIRDLDAESLIYVFTRGEDEDNGEGGEDDVVSDFDLGLLISPQVREASPKTVERAIRELARLRGVL